MSLNKGKAKVKAKSKSVAKGAGKNKAAVMNSRSPKKPMAISGDTMSNYAMYKIGGKVKKYQPGGVFDTRAVSPGSNASSSFSTGPSSNIPSSSSTVLTLAKKGGTTKAKKFAALAPPYNKATAADRIAGAKKNARKK